MANKYLLFAQLKAAQQHLFNCVYDDYLFFGNLVFLHDLGRCE